MSTSSYDRVPPSSKHATPQNASVGEKKTLNPSDKPQLGGKAKPIYYPYGVNGNAPPTVTRLMNKQVRTLYVRACDAVPWKSSAQRAAEEAERLETMRRQTEAAEEEDFDASERRRKERKRR